MRTPRATSAAPSTPPPSSARQTLSGPLYASVGRAWQQTPDERERDLERLVAALGPLAAYAADAGVRLGLEPLNRFETSFVNIAEQAIEIIDRVDSPGLGVLLDTFHMNLEEKSIGDAIRATGSRLSPLPRLRERPRRAGLRPRAVGRGGRRAAAIDSRARS